ncbi:hypothetical protein OUZ56_028565 [Daphnia magna]|uniref:Uncharacterized protein n=1 Tax=Daphnia magna TaxID=35525 RepID=A0ABR0B486_9CRUS|nr:hypothetical protein OUZ56_028565 [Daphnia magna]
MSFQDFKGFSKKDISKLFPTAVTNKVQKNQAKRYPATRGNTASFANQQSCPILFADSMHHMQSGDMQYVIHHIVLQGLLLLVQAAVAATWEAKLCKVKICTVSLRIVWVSSLDSLYK